MATRQASPRCHCALVAFACAYGECWYEPELKIAKLSLAPIAFVDVGAGGCAGGEEVGAQEC